MRWFAVTSHLGVIVSTIWYALGAQDRYYFEGLRKQVRKMEEDISKDFGVTQLENYVFGSAQEAEAGLLTWRLSRISLSRLPALIPAIFAVIWGLTLIFSILGWIIFLVASWM